MPCKALNNSLVAEVAPNPRGHKLIAAFFPLSGNTRLCQYTYTILNILMSVGTVVFWNFTVCLNHGGISALNPLIKGIKAVYMINCTSRVNCDDIHTSVKNVKTTNWFQSMHNKIAKLYLFHIGCCNLSNFKIKNTFIEYIKLMMFWKVTFMHCMCVKYKT